MRPCIEQSPLEQYIWDSVMVSLLLGAKLSDDPILNKQHLKTINIISTEFKNKTNIPQYLENYTKILNNAKQTDYIKEYQAFLFLIENLATMFFSKK